MSYEPKTEEHPLPRTHAVRWECVGWLQKSGMTPETSRTAGLRSPDPDLEPLCAVLSTLPAFAKESFEFRRPPETVELARQTIKKGRADALGATAFLESYFQARKASPDADLEAALLGFAKRTKHRGLATTALNVRVKTDQTVPK